MTFQFKAIASEKIPAYRLLCLRGAGSDDGSIAYIRLALAKERPDFFSREEIADGKEITVTIKGNKVWEAEAGEDIPAGTSIVTGEGGKVYEMNNVDVDSGSTIGYTLHEVKAGEVAKFVNVYKVKESKLN